MFMKKSFVSFIFLALSAAISSVAFADDLSGSGYSTKGVRAQGAAIKGQVIDIRQINIDASPMASNSGKAVGAIIGAAAGAGLAGKNNYAKVAAGALGGVLGGVLGSSVADNTANQAGIEVIVATEKGEAVVISQSVSDGANFNIGDNVWVVKSGGAIRAVRRNYM